MTEVRGPHAGRREHTRDVQALWDVLSGGGIVICPAMGGYTVAGPGTVDGGNRLNQAKGRPGHKRLGLMMGDHLEREVHILDQSKQEMIDCLTKDYNLPVHVIARFNPDHPLIAQLSPEALKLCTANGTITSAVNMGGFFLDAVNARADAGTLFPVFASSCNRSGTAPKYRVADIEPEVIAAADLVIDYGPQWGHNRTTSTQINFETMELVRWGRAFESIAWVLKHHYGIELPPDPGREVAPGGHVNEFALVDAE